MSWLAALAGVGALGNAAVLRALWPPCAPRRPVSEKLLASCAAPGLALACLSAACFLLAGFGCWPREWIQLDANNTWMASEVACETLGGNLPRDVSGITNHSVGIFWIGRRDLEKKCSVCLCPVVIFEKDRNVSVSTAPCARNLRAICQIDLTVPGICEVQGLVTSFLSLLVLWYLALFSLERFLDRLVPEEHTLTFTWLNTKVMLCGLFFVVLPDAAAPVYGWGQYRYSPELGLCAAHPLARHSLVYGATSLAMFYVPALLLTAGCQLPLLLTPAPPPPPPPQRPPPAVPERLGLALCVLLPPLGALPASVALVVCAYDPQPLCKEGSLHAYTVALKIASLAGLPPVLLLLLSRGLRDRLRGSIRLLGDKHLPALKRREPGTTAQRSDLDLIEPHPEHLIEMDIMEDSQIR